MIGSPPQQLVAPLAAVGTDDLLRVGGKAAHLGELVRAGHLVPGGFVVTTDAYLAVVEQSGLRDRIDALLEEATSDELAGAAGAAIRAGFADAVVPEVVRAAIVESYGAAGAGPVAVRSSATTEDLPGATFAGQQDTFLNVTGSDAVVDAVHRCWASLWSDRAITYRRRLGVDSRSARMAVIVQDMVEADAAGVLFTANPVTGARDEIVVEASSGLGEAVVSGMVTPDHYELDRRGHVREWTPGTREVVVRSRAGGGVAYDRSQQTRAQRLPGGLLAELTRVGASVADGFGRPQDIEWAVAEGRCWLLQARPLTALPPPPLELNRVQRVVALQLLEMLPVRPYPLDMTAWLLPGLGRMVSRMLAEIAGIRVDLSSALPETDGVVDRLVPPTPRPTRGTVTAPLRNLRRVRAFDPASWTGDPRFADFERRVDELAEHDPRTLGWQELSRVPRRAMDVLDLITDLRVDYLPRAGADLLRLRMLLALLRSSGHFGTVVAAAPTRTADANAALAALAEQVRAQPSLRRRILEADTAGVAAAVRRAPELAGFRAALDAVVSEYGHRETTSPLLVSTPTWSDAPTAVLGAVQALVDEPSGPRRTDRADEALERPLQHRLVRWTRSEPRLRRVVQAARAAVALREDTHFHATRLLPIVRRSLLEMGRRLVDAGMLRGPSDVFHLRLAELEGLGEPRAAANAEADRVRKVVLQRAARREELAGVPLIAPAVLFPDVAGDDDAIVSGRPASGGRASGPVRVIADPSEFGRLRSGDVLVCPYTNPAWTPLFQRAAAVVVDTGGPASHAAIVAREHGIPAVMGTGAGTSILSDGQIVTVDGDHGRVTAAPLDTTSSEALPQPAR